MRDTSCDITAISYRLSAGHFSKAGNPSANISVDGFVPEGAHYVARKSWSFAHSRRVIELAKAKTSLEEAARIMERTPERIRKVAMRLGVKFKAETKTKR